MGLHVFRVATEKQVVSVAAVTIKRLLTGIIPASILFLLLLVSLYLLTDSTKELSQTITSPKGGGHSFMPIVLINIFGVFFLTLLIGIKLTSLIRKYKRNEPGSRLNARMVVMFTVISVIPVVLVFYFSFQLLNRDIDQQSIDQLDLAVNTALKLSREALDLKKRELLKRTRLMARKLIADDRIANEPLRFDEMRDNNRAAELMVLAGTNIRAYTSAEAVSKPQSPPPDLLMSLKNNKRGIDIKLDPVGDSGLAIRIVVPIFSVSADPTLSGSFEDRFLLATYPIAKRLDKLAKGVEQAKRAYTSRKHLRENLKMSYLLTLGLVFMLSLTAAIWAAFFSTARLVQPITDLAYATRAVADGQYDKQIPSKTHDELGFLVDSFNDMTRRIAQASSAASLSQQQAEEQRTYLQAVLSNLSSGVITLDQNLILRVINSESSEIFAIDMGEFIDKPLENLGVKHEQLKVFIETITPYLQSDQLEWRSQIEIFSKGGRQILLCRGTTLKDEAEEYGDHIVVFDDITALMQAQRDAAWGEVARRLAHEIKNPLTPIQLSAERIRRKYSATMSKEEFELLDKSTHTIVQQVEAMKKMVNEFSEYARAPKVELTELDLNGLIQELSDLYSVSEKSLQLNLSLQNELPMIEADAGRIRQLLHNLIKNSIEAMQDKKEKKLDISTKFISDESSQAIEMIIQDYGDGFLEETDGQHFEPYFTTKPKGTGLGLAIVKRIVEEHNGMVWAENIKLNGARITIRIPVLNYKPSAIDSGNNELVLPQVNDHKTKG